MADIKIISDYFISLSNDTGNLISNLKLQKLVYYAQAWNLAINKEPIFSEDFQAWIHGPVNVELYNTYKKYSWLPIQREDLNEGVFKKIQNRIGEKENKVLDDVVKEYFGLPAFELELLTHSEEPWLRARAGLKEDEPSNNIIEKDWMSAYYSKFVEE